MPYPRLIVNQEEGVKLPRRLTTTRTLPLRILKDRTDEYGTSLSMIVTSKISIPPKTIQEILAWFVEENLAPDVKILDEERGALIIRGSFSGYYPQLTFHTYAHGVIQLKVISHRQSGGGYSLDEAIGRGLVIIGKTLSQIVQNLSWTKSYSIVCNGSELSLSLLK